MPEITLEDLQGQYEIAYQTTPQLEGWYEPGYGLAQIEGNRLHGKDALNTTWDAALEIVDRTKLRFNARLDPSTASGDVGLLDKDGNMTRDIQHYEGEISITKLDNVLILRTRVIQGPLTIDVQFKKIK